MKRYRVKLSAEERQELKTLVCRGRAAAYKQTHGRILLLSDEAHTEGAMKDEGIARVLQIGRATGERVRRRCVEEGIEAALGRKRQLSPNPPMGGVNAGQIGMREPAREKAWAPLDRCDPARVFSSRTGPGERSMEAGNRVIVRSDAAGCTRGRGGREFGGVGAVADSAVRRGVEWLAAGPGRC